jgi:putative redox protein
MKVKAQWMEGYKFKVSDGRGHEIISDLPEKFQGKDTGPTGLEISVMGLAVCISAVFAIICNNSGIQFSELSAESEAHKPRGAKIITQAKTIIKVKSDAPEEKLKRILKKAEDICPVGLIFEKAGIKVEAELIAEGL